MFMPQWLFSEKKWLAHKVCRYNYNTKILIKNNVIKHDFYDPFLLLISTLQQHSRP